MLLFAKSRCCSSDSFVNEDGIVPISELEFKLKKFNLVKCERTGGIDPRIPPLERSITAKLVKSPIASGIWPRLCLGGESACTYPSLQDTPDHPHTPYISVGWSCAHFQPFTVGSVLRPQSSAMRHITAS